MGPILGPMPLNISSSPSNDQLVENQGEAEEVNFKTFLLRTRGVGDLLNLFGFFQDFLKYFPEIQVEITMPADGKIDHQRSRFNNLFFKVFRHLPIFQGIPTASSGARYLASHGFSPSSATWASACRQVGNEANQQ